LPRIVFLTAALFFVPSAVLGMVTPLVVKLNLRDLDHAGDVVGKIYAISTAGAIFGVFITGFVLVQWLGTRQTILLVALILVGMSLAFGGLWRVRMPTMPMIVLFVGIGGFSSISGDLNSGCLKESNYFCIQVTDDIVDGRHKVKALHLDKLLHSYVSLEDPTLLAYNYEKVFSELITLVAQRDPGFRTLIIGGGGYTVPRYLETLYPKSTVVVIEIDPAVTRVAFDHLGLPCDTRIVTYNEDARMTVPKLNSGQYALVIGDAFNDLSVPYHLTTREFNEQIAGLLTPDGIYAVNVVDKFQSGRFARAFVHTLKETFPNVYVIREDDNWPDDGQKTHVVAASVRPLSYESLRNANIQAGRGALISHFMPDESMERWLNARKRVLLTDDRAPVDNMLAALHLEGTGPSRASTHYNYGVELEAQGRTEDAIAAYSEAIRLDPGLSQAYNNRGLSYIKLGEYLRANQESDQAIRIDPRLAQAYNNRGFSYSNLGQYQKAILDYDEAIRLNPRFALAYSNRGSAHDEMSKPQKAIDDFDRAILFDPRLDGAYVNRGYVYLNTGDLEKAIDDFDNAIGLDPRLVLAYVSRALAYTLQGNDAKSRDDAAIAIELGFDVVEIDGAIERARSRR